MLGSNRTIAIRLRKWYVKHARDLPWRRTSDPYPIWVSEVMLQQTQVKTVVPYFHRFLREFPTLRALAAAELDDVLRVWQGLGYYRRAMNLHEAAREVVRQHDGAIPMSLTELQRLPGVGRYIAGAILSFAFHIPTPILEANSARVLCRLFALRGPVNDSRVQKRLWDLSAALLPEEDEGVHNQALMELGALVCQPKDPRCDSCPLRRQCVAHREGLTAQIPARSVRPAVLRVRDAAAVIRRQGRVLIVRRPAEQRWGGLWELPRTTVNHRQDPRSALQTHVRDSLGLHVTVGPHILTVKHDVTHHRITLACYECTQVQGRVRIQGYDNHRWESPDRLHEHPFSSPQRRLITAIQRLAQ